MIRTDLLPEELNDQARFQRVARRHLDAIAWEPRGYIPLGIIVNNPANVEGIGYDQWLDAAVFFEVQAKILRDTLMVGSDYMPILPINHLGDALIPSMFGARLHVPSNMAGSLGDQGPAPLPVIDEVEAIDALRLPDMRRGIMPEFTQIITAWRRWAPPWVQIVTTFPIGPFSLAHSLRGSDIFTELVDHPHRIHKLLELCSEVQVQVELHLRGLIGEAKPLGISNFGVRSHGIRLGDDTIINLSPEMITEFALPHIEKIAERFGPATVHYCTLPHRRADHVFGPLAASPRVAMASTQFGFEYYDAHVDALGGRLAVESFYGAAYEYVREKFGSFRDWAFDFVPRRKNDSGLILYFEVPSVELGNELWATWQEAHRK